MYLEMMMSTKKHFKTKKQKIINEKIPGLIFSYFILRQPSFLFKKKLSELNFSVFYISATANTRVAAHLRLT